MGRKGTRYERVGDPWHPRRLRVVKGARRPFEATCAPAVDAADGKAWRWEGDRTGRGPAKLVFGVAPEAKESKEEEKKEETTPRRKDHTLSPLGRQCTRMTVPFADAVASMAPSRVSAMAATGELWHCSSHTTWRLTQSCTTTEQRGDDGSEDGRRNRRPQPGNAAWFCDRNIR